MLTKQQVIANIDALEKQGASQIEIQSYLDGIKTRQTTSSIQIEQPKQEQGFFQSLIQDPLKTLVVKPAVRTGQLLGYGIGKLAGIPEENLQQALKKDVSMPSPLGNINIEAQKPFGEGGGRQIVGDAAKTASYLVGGAGEASAIANPSLLSKVGLGFKAGATAGGSYSFGDAIADAENQPTDVAMKTLFGVGFGGVLGGATPAVISGVSNVSSKVAGKVSNLVNIATKEESALANLATKYDSFLGLTARQSKLEQKFGKDTPAFLAKEFRGELPLSVTNGTRDLTEAISAVKTKYTAEAQAFNNVLKNSGEYGSIDDLAIQAKRLAREQFSGTDLNKALNQIDNEVQAFKEQYKPNAVYTVEGKQRLPISDINEIKGYQWGRAKGFGSPDAVLANDTNFLIGKAAQKQIEDTMSDVTIKNWNRRLGDFASAIKMLENRDKLPVKNRFLNRLTGRIIGGISGSAFGPMGTIPSAITGDWVAQQLSNPEISTIFIKQVLKRLPAAQRNSILQEAQIILDKIAQERGSRLFLPPPTPLGSAKNPIIPVAPTTYEAPSQLINRTRTTVNPKTGDLYVRDLKTGKVKYVPKNN
jgi:hypothetical protein